MKELFSPWHSGRTLSSQALRIQRSRWLVAVVLCCFMKSIALNPSFSFQEKKIETKIWNRKPGFKAIKYVCSLLLVTLGLIKIGILCATVLISMYEIELEFLLLGYMLFSHYSLCYFTGLPAFQAIVTQNDCVSNCGCTCIWCHLVPKMW